MNEVFEFVSRDGVIDVEVRYNPRRRTRMGLLFDPEGRLLIDAPPGTALDEVKALLNTYERWIRYRSHSAQTEMATWYPRSYTDGVLLFYKGDPYPLSIREGRDQVALADGMLRVTTRDSARVKDLVWDWYRRRVDIDLGAVLAALVPTLPWLDETPAWRHRYMRSQWGSCTGGGRVSLNTHLVKLAPPLIEYVVQHELCHIQYLNHGPRFYQLMDVYMTDWKDRRKQLNRYTGMLAE